MLDRESAGRAEMASEQRARSAPRDPADGARNERHRRDLGRRNEQDLRASRAEPRQPAPHGKVVAAQARRRQHREAKQEDGSVSAEHEQPLASDTARRSRRRDRVRRRRDAEEIGGLLEFALRAVDPRAKAGQLP